MGNQYSNQSYADNTTDIAHSGEETKLDEEEWVKVSHHHNSDEYDKDDDEEFVARLLILEDAKKLKKLAVAFLHPEMPVEVSCTAMARCYFDRHSAHPQECYEESKYRDIILEDSKQLKQLAADYRNPELKVVSIGSARARCYFDRPSAIPQESVEDSQRKSEILEDVKRLRQFARDYLHPEDGVTTMDHACTARCYFDRYLATAQESAEMVKERERMLADMTALKTLAVTLFHPKKAVETYSTACARCYYDRYSSPEQETFEEVEERHVALEDTAALKILATQSLRPDIGVLTSDPSACARCYFDRPSAPQQESMKGAEQYHEMLVDVLNLKMLAVNSKIVPKSKALCKRVTFKMNDNDQRTRVSASVVILYGLDDNFADTSFF